MVLKTARIIFESFPITKSQPYDIIVQLLMEKKLVMVTSVESILIEIYIRHGALNRNWYDR